MCSGGHAPTADLYVDYHGSGTFCDVGTCDTYVLYVQLVTMVVLCREMFLLLFTETIKEKV